MKVYLRPSATGNKVGPEWGLRWEVNGVLYDFLTVGEALIHHERLGDYIRHWVRAHDPKP